MELYTTFLPSVDCPECGYGMINCNSHNETVDIKNPKYMKCSNKDCLKLGKTYKRVEVRIEAL